MKNKNKVIIGIAVAIMTGAITVIKNCKRWFREDYHRHKMEVGCKICTKEVDLCPKCYYCSTCRPEHCK